MRRSQDYYEHIFRVHRTPSEITDVPRYPGVHIAFGKKATIHGEDEGCQNYGYPLQARHDDERVEVVDYGRTTNPANWDGEATYVDSDQYYPKKNRGGFELHPWKTFRP
ncbi:hypothetical protein HN51_062677 [Arachis hypogaea]|nr:uncharacterized protein DS421_11g335380 [Arachis hypogaea]